METKLIHRSSVFELYALERERCLLAYWYDASSFDGWMQANQILMMETLDRGYTNYISDIQNCTPISEDQFAYLTSDIIPQHRRSGLKNIVFITPDNLELELITRTMFHKIMPMGFNTLHAKTLQEGLEWLRLQRQ